MGPTWKIKISRVKGRREKTEAVKGNQGKSSGETN